MASRDKDRAPFPEIPALKVAFEYSDIGEAKHQAIFEIKFEVIALGIDGKSIDGYLEPKKVA